MRSPVAVFNQAQDTRPAPRCHVGGVFGSHDEAAYSYQHQPTASRQQRKAATVQMHGLLTLLVLHSGGA